MRSGGKFGNNDASSGQIPDVLTSWPEIASYVSRTVRTVQRWVDVYDFPVYRDTRGGVRAVPAEIDEWMAKPLSFRSRADYDANRRWTSDLRRDSEELIERSRALRKQAQSERAQAQQLHKRA
jgi:hypothetical protein